MGKDDDLVKNFEKAASDIKSSKLKLDDETLGSLYGYYKQATVGDCNVEQPGFFDIKGRAKYDAWNQYKGMSKEHAMKRYIKKVEKLLEKK
jgi:diazepam-binding inhibitor (GABA receptor modulating acyl-CoA-binding protein)